MSPAPIPKQIAFAALAFLAGASMWFYVQRIAVPHQEKDAAANERPRGNLSDLYPRWLGARELLLHGRDPYSREVTLEIQQGYYGRTVDSSRPNDPKDQQGFAYPVYVAFLLAPTIGMDFATVRTAYLWLSTGCTILSILLWKRTLRIALPPLQTLAIVTLVVGSYPFAEAFYLQQPLLVVALIVAGSFLARLRGWYFLSGVLLAIATVKPQIALLPVVLALCWVSAGWRERQRWFWGFAATMLLLVGAAQYILPGWLFRFYGALHAYSNYIAGTAFLEWLVGPRFAWIARVAILLPVIWIVWRYRQSPAGSVQGRRLLSLSLVAGVCIAPNLAIYNQVLLLPALFLLWDQREVLRESGLVARNLTMIVWLLLSWQWVASGLLAIAKVVFRADHFVMRAWQIPLYTALSLPLALLLLLFLWPSARTPAKTLEETFTSA